MEAIEPQGVNRLWMDPLYSPETVVTGQLSDLQDVDNFVGNFYRHVDALP